MSKTAKTSLFFLIICAIFWLGAINIRALIGNELLIYDEFNFRRAIPPDEENMIFKLLSNASIVVITFYVLTFISAIAFIKTSKISFKNNGWYLMSVIMFFVFSPVEFYTAYLDIKFMMLFETRPANHDELLLIFGERNGFLRGVPWIALLCYYTIIWLSVFRPLTRTNADIEQEKNLREQNTYKYIFHEEDDLAPVNNIHDDIDDGKAA